MFLEPNDSARGLGLPLRLGLLQAWRCRGQPPRLRGHASPGHVVPLKAEFTKFSHSWDGPQIGAAWWKQNHPNIVPARARVEDSKIENNSREQVRFPYRDCLWTAKNWLQILDSGVVYLTVYVSIYFLYPSAAGDSSPQQHSAISHPW